MRRDDLAHARQSLLVRVRIGARQVLRDRVLQMIGRAESEGAGIADVELDQRAAACLEFQGPAGEFAADFVTDLGQALAGDDGGLAPELRIGEDLWKRLPENKALWERAR
jgi:hypothetical protein